MSEEKSDTKKITDSQAAPAVAPATVPLSPEAPAKDGELAINQSATPEAKKTATVPASEAPVVVSEADVAAAQPNPDQLSEQVEVLTGEIQALESKIERMTGTNMPAPAEGAEVTIGSQTASQTNPEVKPTVTSDASTFVTVPPVAQSNSTAAATSSINDIYPKTTVREDLESDKAAADRSPEESVPTAEPESKTTILIVAEALIFFGLAVFILVILSPLYSATIGPVVTGVLHSIGWPVVIVTTLLGILASFLARGTWGLRIMAIVIALISVLVFLGTTAFLSLGPLADLLEPVLRMYR